MLGRLRPKAAGYGQPLKLLVREASGTERKLVYHTATANQFGHERRADRAAEMLVAFDTMGDIPLHVRPLDVGAIRRDGSDLISLAEAGEFYLLTEWAEGHVYADELRAIAERGSLLQRDRDHTVQLARYLAGLHERSSARPSLYTRAVRDLVGSGEGIFGIVDGFPSDTLGAPPARLEAIERSCLSWRWRLAGREARLSKIHGDFHPFNVIFDNDELALLDASRGCLGEPADDVSCMAINYLFFALDDAATWGGALRELWYIFWEEYLHASRDEALLHVVAPFLTWRALVLACPAWYPDLSLAGRDALLSLAEKALEADRFEPYFAEGLLPGAV